MVIIVGTALISAENFLEPELLEAVLDMSNITVYLGIITLIYFLLILQKTFTFFFHSYTMFLNKRQKIRFKMTKKDETKIKETNEK